MVRDGKVMEEMKIKIEGIMRKENYEKVREEMRKMRNEEEEMG